jgi:hypothetical protein
MRLNLIALIIGMFLSAIGMAQEVRYIDLSGVGQPTDRRPYGSKIENFTCGGSQELCSSHLQNATLHRGVAVLSHSAGKTYLDSQKSVDAVTVWSLAYDRCTTMSPFTRIHSPGFSAKNVSGLVGDPYNSSQPTKSPPSGTLVSSGNLKL